MTIRIAAAFFLIAMFGQAALADNEPRAMQPQGGLFQGTPEEQAACAPDASRFCKDQIPDTFRVLACLQQNRAQLRKECQQVLINHGQ